MKIIHYNYSLFICVLNLAIAASTLTSHLLTLTSQACHGDRGVRDVSSVRGVLASRPASFYISSTQARREGKPQEKTLRRRRGVPNYGYSN